MNWYRVRPSIRSRRMRAAMLGAAAIACMLVAIAAGFEDRLRRAYYAHVLGTPIIAGEARTPLDCNKIRNDAAERLLVVLVAGQSNSANYGQGRRNAGDGVVDFQGDRCYRARDPLLNAQGGGASIWVRLGDLLVKADSRRTVVFSSVGVGTTAIDDWAPGGRLHARLLSAAVDLQRAGFRITHVLWQQGETDALKKTSSRQYVTKFDMLVSALRNAGVRAPVYVAISSYCDGTMSDDVRSAQREVVNADRGVRAGPDTDRFRDSLLRYDNCHFSAAGLEAAAKAWLDVLSDDEAHR